MSRLYLRIGRQWLSAIPQTRPDGTVVTDWQPSGPPPSKPRPTPSNMLNAETIKSLAENVAPAVATEILNLVAAGIIATRPGTKPTLAADLVNAYTQLREAYDAVKVVVADLRG